MSVPVAFVLQAMALIHNECSFYSKYKCEAVPGHFEKTKDAIAIAQAVADREDDFRQAVEDVVYSSFESANDLSAKGDKDKNGRFRSFGAWQIPVEGLDTAGQLSRWATIRQNSLVQCSFLPSAERMAKLASGSCYLGRDKVSRRDREVERVLGLALAVANQPE